MNDYSKRIFEMLVRVMVFRTIHQDLIGKNTQADQLFTKIDSILDAMASQSTAQTAGENTVRVSNSDRDEARADLRRQLEVLSRTAASVGAKEFYMPRGKGDRAMVNVARVFAELAEPLQEMFVSHGLPPDFVAKLRGTTDRIVRVIQRQGESKEARHLATKEILTGRAQALEALSRLDPIMENVLRDKAPQLSAWKSARRVAARTSRSTKPPDPVIVEPPAPAERPSAPL